MRNVAHHLQRGNSLTMNTDADEEVYEEDADIPDNYSEKVRNAIKLDGKPSTWQLATPEATLKLKAVGDAIIQFAAMSGGISPRWTSTSRIAIDRTRQNEGNL